MLAVTTTSWPLISTGRGEPVDDLLRHERGVVGRARSDRITVNSSPLMRRDRVAVAHCRLQALRRSLRSSSPAA